MSIKLLDAFGPMLSAIHVISPIKFPTLDLEFDPL
jgi:hypothetical protein